MSNPFSINSDASFTYGVEYGVSDSSLAAEFLGETESVNFKVLLIDNTTGETLGEFDDVAFTKNNLSEYENIAYQVNTSGIGSRTVYLKLQIENNFESSYSLTDAIHDDATLAKNGYKNINFNDGIDKITSYDLSQNFPNPFNPTTTINYQLPQNGFVTLKIYDILGKEVATLVNEQKSTGRYSVNFDASNLSSGVYIYQIHINDYVSSKKLLLLK